MKITLVGDTNLYGRTRPVEAFAAIASSLTGHDVLLGHAEGMFTRDKRELPFKVDWVHSAPETACGFVEAGFDGVSFASNVCADRQAVIDTIVAAQQAGLRFCGIGMNRSEARQALMIEKPAGRVAMLSRTSVFWPPLVPATIDHAGAATVKAHTAYVPARRAAEMPGCPPDIHTWPDAHELDDLRHDITTARSQADWVVLSMHWGVSGSALVQAYQRDIARTAIDAGADVVFGHHPHVIQPIEVYRGRPIFFSLGNFAFDLPKMHGRHREGLVVKLHLRESSIQCAVLPVQRNEKNLIAPLAANDPAWKTMTQFLLDHAEPSLRRGMMLDEQLLRFDGV